MSEENKAVEFDASKYDLFTQLIFSDWASMNCIRLYRVMYFATKKGQSMYSQRGMAKMLGISKTTLNRVLNLMIEKGALVKNGNYYQAVLAGKLELEGVPVCDTPVPVDGTECTSLPHRSVPVGEQKCTSSYVHNIDHNIDKNIEEEIGIKLSLQEEEEREREVGIESTYTLPTKTEVNEVTVSKKETKTKKETKRNQGALPSPFDGKLPPTLLAKFQAQGKEEVFENVWMKIPDYEALEKEFGEPNCYAALRSMYEWSVNEDCAAGGKIPGYKSYHAKADHAKTMRNLILRSLANGKVAKKGLRGYEFVWATSTNGRHA